MTATSKSSGHPTEFDAQLGWIYTDTRKPVVGSDRPCSTCGRKTVRVCVTIPADLSHTKKERLGMKRIDACIAPIVLALEASGIHMRGSCCGHGKEDGGIVLQDGRILVIKKWAKEPNSLMYDKERKTIIDSRGKNVGLNISSEEADMFVAERKTE